MCSLTPPPHTQLHTLLTLHVPTWLHQWATASPAPPTAAHQNDSSGSRVGNTDFHKALSRSLHTWLHNSLKLGRLLPLLPLWHSHQSRVWVLFLSTINTSILIFTHVCVCGVVTQLHRKHRITNLHSCPRFAELCHKHLICNVELWLN